MHTVETKTKTRRQTIEFLDFVETPPKKKQNKGEDPKKILKKPQKNGQKKKYLHVVYYYSNIDMLLLSNNIRDYHFVSQGKTSIPGLDDGEELLATDVSPLIKAKKKTLRQ